MIDAFQASKALLDAEEAELRAGIGQTLVALRTTAADTVRDAHRHAGEVAGKHPYVTLGSAIIVGFAAATAVVPSRKQQMLAKLAALQAALHPRAPSPAKPRSTFGRTLRRAAIRTLKPTLMNVLAVALAKRSAAQNAATNGHDATPNAN
jgi:hypothetical protein